MIEKNLTYLDFPKLLEIYKKFAETRRAKELLTSLEPLNSIKAINERLEKTEALLEIIRIYGKIPIYDVSSLAQILKKLSKENSLLEIEEILEVFKFLEACGEVFRYFKRIPQKNPSKERFSVDIDLLSELYSYIRRVINLEGFIEDSASFELMRIRTELSRLKERTKKKLEEIMARDQVRAVVQDFYITIRNGRYVIPLKPNFNQFFQGIVHDYSYSLKTSFVEPLEVVELNNAINLLSNAEKEEERKILAELTTFLRKYADKLERNLHIVEEIDFYQALCLFNMEFQCTRPEVKEKGSLHIKSALNPFIVLSKKEKAVPIDILFDEGKSALIISGPNAGGKTVALKTIGLLVLMAHCGLFVPSRGKAEIPLFSGIYALIGDEQDISTELSTFTAHISLIRDFYNVSRGGELILIDEIGGNTDPHEASALAMAIIDGFVEKGCKVVVTTHSNLLKSYGQTKEFASNVATAYDEERMMPLYFLKYGGIGSSNAMKVAEKIGLPKDLIRRGYEYLGREEYIFEELLESLKNEKERIHKEREEVAKLREEAKRRVELIRDKKKEILKRLEERFERQAMEIEREIEEIRKEISRKDKASLHKAKEKLTVLKKKFENKREEAEKVKVGDFVRLKIFDKKGGYVIGEEKDHYIVMMGNLKTKVKKEFLERAKEEKEMFSEEKKSFQVFIDKPDERLNVRGMRVQEALEMVDRFLNRAIVHGMESVKILHGIGSGRLMMAIREHLKGISFVKKVMVDEKNPGITVVEFQ